MKINPGRYYARVSDYGFVASQAGDPLAFIVFAFKDGEILHHLTWRGSFKEGKAREITLKALALCSNKIQRGNELVPSIVLSGLDPLADGKASKMLDMEGEVSIDVELETNPKDGKVYPRIRWVNPAGGTHQRLMLRNDVSIKLAGMNIKADLIKLGQETAIKHEPRVIANDELDNLPF